MDNDKKLFEALLKADGIDPAGATESERIAFAKILDRQSKPKPSKPGIVRPDIWRIIMQSKITKLTAAAAIILVGITIINQFGGSIDGSSVAWADVVEEINNYTRYKCRQRVVRQDGTYFPTMDVYHLNLSQRRQEVENGDIHIIDMRGADAITVELKPAEMKATVTKLIGFGPRKDPHIIEMVKRFEQESTERLGTKEVDGKILQGFRHVPNAGNDFTVWVDPETKLPVEIELVHTRQGQTIFLDEFEFDFELDESAFSTEIPEGYEVEILTQDYRPVEAKDVTAEDMQGRFEQAADPNHEQDYVIQSPDGPQEFIPYSCTETIYRGGKEFFHKMVSHKTRSLRREIHSDDDSIHIVDLSKRPVRILRMDPKNMTASLKILYNMGPAKNPDMLAKLASMRKYDSRKLGIQEIDGISAEGFLDAYRDITIWADMETGLPVKIEVVHARRNGRIVLTDFDFEPELDESLFLTVPPEGYDLKTKTTPEK